MIKFFRTFRQNLLSENKLSKYVLYAVGEILLVVIGILIALSINNWNIYNKERKLEKQYLAGLINDLQTDSLFISDLKTVSDEQIRRKKKLYQYFEGQEFTNDSIAHFFTLQWGMAVGFNPVTATFDEMTSTGGLSVIQNPNVRKEIIKTYNYYQTFINGSQAYYERNRGELRKLSFKIPRVFDVESLSNATKPDIIEALENSELRNGIMANYAISVNSELAILQNENNLLLALIRSYFSEI